MDRERLINRIKLKIEEEPLLDVDKNFIKDNYKNKNNGIYFLYDDNETVIYVGKCGDGNNTSFHHRIYKHGNSAHCKKAWFSQVKKFRFKSFPDYDSKTLAKVERLMIYAKHQPAYNDCYTTEMDHETILSGL